MLAYSGTMGYWNMVFALKCEVKVGEGMNVHRV